MEGHDLSVQFFWNQSRTIESQEGVPVEHSNSKYINPVLSMVSYANIVGIKIFNN